MKTIFTNGCFDILHRGHIELFTYAKSLGDVLYVGVDSDEKVKKDKGEDRPINSLEDRMQALWSIKYIDGVCSFKDTKGLSDLVKSIKPDILVVGSDWKGKPFTGYSLHIPIYFHERDHDYSTSDLRKRIVES